MALTIGFVGGTALLRRFPVDPGVDDTAESEGKDEGNLNDR